MKPCIRSITFYQEADCCGESTDQELTIGVEDGGGGAFVTLRTQRWALDPEQGPWLAEWIERLCREWDGAQQ
jgi:hypothetical protein